MNLKQLQYFKTVAELQHMTKAADRLLVAQPFLSKTIAQLETELGVQLFDHVGRQIQLNEYGRAFYHRTQKIFEEIENAQAEIDDMLASKEKNIALSTNVSLYMPGLLSGFHNQFPQIHLHYLSARRKHMQEMLISGEVDFIIATPPIEDNPAYSLKTVEIICDELYIIFPDSHPLKKRKEKISLAELGNENFITALRGFGIRDLAEGIFHQSGIQPQFIIETSDTSSIQTFVKAGLGIAFAPQSATNHDPFLRECRIRVADPHCCGHVGLTWQDSRFKSKAFKAFKDFVIEHFMMLQQENLSMGIQYGNREE